SPDPGDKKFNSRLVAPTCQQNGNLRHDRRRHWRSKEIPRMAANASKRPWPCSFRTKLHFSAAFQTERATSERFARIEAGNLVRPCGTYSLTGTLAGSSSRENWLQSQ